MSNAMRMGKRTLAGVAAGALAAGFMTFVSMPGAQAGVATTLDLEFPSVTVISAANTTAIPVDIDVKDVSGDDATSLPANTSIRVSVTKPTTATAQTDDTFIGIVMSTDDTLVSDETTAFSDVTFKIGGASDKTDTNVAMPWASATTAGYVGTYTITACFFNSASGACSGTKTMDFTLVASAGAPAATITFLNETYYNPISALGVSADDSVQVAPKFQLAITDAKGGPYVMDSGNVDFTVSSGSTLGTLTQDTGYGRAVLGTYSVSASGVGSTWGTAGTRILTAAATPNGSVVSGSSNLPVNVASINETPAGISAELTNTVAFRPDSDDDTWQVPPGTTELNFSVATNDAFNSPSTLAWNTQLTDSAGVASPAGGAAAVDASSGSVTVSLNDAAAGVGETAYFVAGSYQPSALGDDSIARIEVQFVAPTVTVTGTNGLTKVGTATTIPGTVLTQYGSTVPGTFTVKAYVGTVACSTTATPAATATADASGNFSVTIPAEQVPAAPTTGQVYSLCATNGFDTPTRGLVSWTYTATGGVTSLTLASTPSNTSTLYPLVRVPAAGVVDLNTATSATVAYNATPQAIATAVNSTTTVARTAVSLTATVSPVGVPVTFSSETALFTDKTSGTIFTTAGSNIVSVVATGGTASVEAFATTSGTHTVTVSAGETSTTMKFTASPAAGSGRQIALSPTSQTIGPDSFYTFTATVTDLYGNVVPDDTAAITLGLNGGGTINPAAGTRGTSLAGTFDVTYTAPSGSGIAQLVMTGNNFQTGTIPFGAALVDEAKADITVTSGPDPSEKTILIVGERDTVRGKPGVVVEGTSTGLDAGTVVAPWFKFPGQTSYSQGVARREISEVGDFTWQRRTGKKIYVYFKTEDGATKSNRVIIQAK